MKKSHCLKQTIQMRQRERLKEKRRSHRMLNKLACLQPCPIYIDLFIFNLEYVKMEIVLVDREKHTNSNDEYCTIYISAVQLLEKTSMILSRFFVSPFSFFLTHFLSLVLCQTHSLLMEFQNTSYIVRARERETTLLARTHTHTLTNIFIILSQFFSSLCYCYNNYSLFHLTHNGRQPVFQNTHTYRHRHRRKVYQSFIAHHFIQVSSVHYFRILITTIFICNSKRRKERHRMNLEEYFMRYFVQSLRLL